ncbi:type II toxin-antitoxin system prevent-host-death family antitoxin [Deferribacteraceae bacterium V6Fe1]|nr:type II toxin-antitoxin system prevent-host-death family antitoxin [Deferribacteraceae bacterium V6Fe1]
METIFYSKAREKLAELMDKVSTDHVPITIVRRNKGNVVLISEEDLRSYEETAYLLKSITNASRLHESAQELSEGKGYKKQLIED